MRGHAQAPAVLAAPAAPAGAQSPTPGHQQLANNADATQKQEIAKQSAELLKMATALKIEVDKTNQDTLSISVIRKANELEQVARKDRNGSGKS